MADSKGRLEGKVVLVTGAGNGMGFATTKLFTEEGAKVIAVDLRENDLAKWNDNANVVPVVADITKLEDIERMVTEAEKRFGRLDAVCNIAGINDLGYPLEDTDDERWDRVHNLDLKAPFRICRRAIPFMLKNGGGSIVNIGSYAAVRGNHGPSYTAAKAGLIGLTKSVAVQYAEQGIRSNIINPGGVQTNLGEHSGGNYHPAMASLSKINAAMPVQCYLDPIEIARACLFLCSDESKFINGAVIAVDKGMACC
jgi:NAD(P)-dependent dehydrogenase (short-subunit alcohol dehydrogenase family)